MEPLVLCFTLWMMCCLLRLTVSFLVLCVAQRTYSITFHSFYSLHIQCGWVNDLYSIHSSSIHHPSLPFPLLGLDQWSKQIYPFGLCVYSGFMGSVFYSLPSLFFSLIRIFSALWFEASKKAPLQKLYFIQMPVFFCDICVSVCALVFCYILQSNVSICWW